MCCFNMLVIKKGLKYLPSFKFVSEFQFVSAMFVIIDYTSVMYKSFALADLRQFVLYVWIH